MTYYNTKNQKSDGSFETSQKNYSNNEKIAEKTATKKKTIYIKIITTIFNNIAFSFLCQSKKRPKHF